MFDTVYSQLFGVVTLAVVIFAFLKGEEPERIGVIANSLAWFAAGLVQQNVNPYATQYSLFALDIVVLLVFAGLAWKSARTWPVWAAGFQMFAVLGHIVVMIGLKPPAYSFYTVLAMAAYGVLGAIAVGTFWAWQDRVAREGV